MVLEVDNITKLYKKNRGAMNVSFSIGEGEVFGLLGPNGSGKTTVMKIVTGLLRAKEGRVKIFGYDIVDDTQRALADVGGLIEAPASIGFLSAYENLKIVSNFYPDCMGIDELLDMVGLLKVKNDKVSKFSLGMKQRMGIALAVINKPKLLVLDEPTNGLDIEGTVDIRNMISNLAKEQKTTVLISSHLAAELQQMCSKVGVMQDGRLLETEVMDFVLENYPSLEDYFLHTVRKSREGLGYAN
ncbi:MAG: ABC transporter ATP-binding protein [Clostridiales bacterium]|jgi:ABC-2 type transport system ATP-binding protein|nr:ABC transporter ATP-binding protein [Clostridiales bacterium]